MNEQRSRLVALYGARESVARHSYGSYATVVVPDAMRGPGRYRGDMVIGVGDAYPDYGHASAWQDAIRRCEAAGWPAKPPKHPEYS